jgi:tripartite-type tricarboxylate transporter receptor subunit TctC
MIRLSNRRPLAGLALGMALTVLATLVCPTDSRADAASYPDRPVKVIVPFAPGGGTDTIARGLTQRLTALWGRNVFVENRPGAGTIPGAEAAAKAAPDGYTLLFTEPATFVINPHLYRKLPYDPVADFAPITVVCWLSPALAVSNSVPARNMAELIAYARANPGKLSYGSFGNGSYSHVSMEHFRHMAGVDLLHVPYRGSAGAVPAILSGELSMILVNMSVFESNLKAGKLKVLGAATERRLPVHPDLPTIGETVPGFSINAWFSLAAPARTPEDILDRIHASVVKVLGEREFIDGFLRPASVEPGGISRQAFTELIRRELPVWGEMVRHAGIQPE